MRISNKRWRDTQSYIDWDYFTLKNSYLIGGRETMTNNVTELMKGMMKLPSRINRYKSTPTYIGVKLQSIKSKKIIWKAQRKGKLPKQKSIRITADFTLAKVEARIQWHSNLKYLRENNCQPIILYLPKILFKNKCTKTFFQPKYLSMFISYIVSLRTF